MRWTPLAQRFVERYEAEIDEHESLSAFMLTAGFKKDSYKIWRKEIPGFAAKIELIEAKRDGQRVPASLVLGLSRDEEKFIIHFHETNRRAEAIDLVGWTPQDLRDRLSESEEFRQAYELIEERLVMRIEDENRGQAAAGTNVSAMRLALQADNPAKYHRKSGEAAGETVQAFSPSSEGIRAAARKWGDRFGFHAEEG